MYTNVASQISALTKVIRHFVLELQCIAGVQSSPNLSYIYFIESVFFYCMTFFFFSLFLICYFVYKVMDPVHLCVCMGAVMCAGSSGHLWHTAVSHLMWTPFIALLYT